MQPNLHPDRRSFRLLADITTAFEGVEPKAGETVYQYTGHTFGCEREDAAGGLETIACTLSSLGDTPFFTVPVEYLEPLDGLPAPRGAYIVNEAIKPSPGPGVLAGNGAGSKSPDDDLGEPLPPRTCSIDDEACESCQ